MEGYQAGRLAKIGFIGTMLALLALRACGDTVTKVVDDVPVVLDDAIQATRAITNDLVADNIEPQLAADAATRIAQISQALDKADISVSSDAVAARLHAETLREVISGQDLRRVCDGEKAAAPELSAVQPSISDAFDAKLEAGGFVIPRGQRRENALGNVSRFRMTLAVCFGRDISRAVANGSSRDDIGKLVEAFRSRTNNQRIELAPYVAMIDKRESLITRLGEFRNGDTEAAKAVVLSRLSKMAVEQYADLEVDLAHLIQDTAESPTVESSE